MLGQNKMAYRKWIAWVPLKWMKTNEWRRKREVQKSVLTIASYDFERHRGWHIQTALSKIYHYLSADQFSDTLFKNITRTLKKNTKVHRLISHILTNRIFIWLSKCARDIHYYCNKILLFFQKKKFGEFLPRFRGAKIQNWAPKKISYMVEISFLGS